MAENIHVYVRFRPSEKSEVNIHNNQVDIGTHSFAFDKIFAPDTEQETIFNTVAKNAVEWVCQGYNSSIFVYGCTSSGKSYTMFGTEKNPGIIPRSCELIFNIIQNDNNVIDAKLKCSFLEIYCEHIKDLLSPNNQNLQLRQNHLKGVYVQGLIEKFVYTPQDILKTIQHGAQQRATVSTALNNTSSRSHAVLCLTLMQTLADGSEISSRLNLIDLAGSENVEKSEVQGLNLVEAQMINKSLSCLGNVIYALTEKGREHIPYRDSKLTFLLQDSLGGNSKTILIATASPLKSSETLSTLKFAKRSKDIKNIPMVNKNESNANLLKTIDMLNKRILELENSQKDGKALNPICEQQKRDIENLKEKLGKTQELFEKQRALCNNIRKEFFKERISYYATRYELEQYKMLFESLKEAVDKPPVLALLVSRANITSYPTPDDFCIDDEIM